MLLHISLVFKRGTLVFRPTRNRPVPNPERNEISEKDSPGERDLSPRYQNQPRRI